MSGSCVSKNCVKIYAMVSLLRQQILFFHYFIGNNTCSKRWGLLQSRHNVLPDFGLVQYIHTAQLDLPASQGMCQKCISVLTRQQHLMMHSGLVAQHLNKCATPPGAVVQQ